MLKNAANGRLRGTGFMRNEKAAAKAIDEVQIQETQALSGGAIDQVRELLFGENKRATEQRLDDIDRKIESLRDDMNARFASLEARLAEQGRDMETRRLASIDAIGQAIAGLGASIRAMGDGGKGR